MNRREVLTGIAAAISVPPEMTITDRLRAQYEICKVRGHRPTIWGNVNPLVTFSLGYMVISDGPPPIYPNVGEGQWQTCWDCKTVYRFNTTIEEKDTP
jgi:hypothetical protein